ncbi:DEKNAAC104582 [Brettanomyces naardenensis]|uniref:DEKNAAC104582 n=1 Tax=Brettanomyces naardenensis TaxID=13370 RepID=A0A448YQW5_BRENA|nr:DEKNAAC104582 [Brettanomyces naardenensis]
MKEHIFVGATSRSRNGCFNCRRMKKKCDEVHPICGSCMKRKIECRWRPQKSKDYGRFNFDLGNLEESYRLIAEEHRKATAKRRKRHQSVGDKRKRYKDSKEKSQLITSDNSAIHAMEASPAVSSPPPLSSEEMRTMIDNIVNHVKSPNFNPETNNFDNIVSNALLLYQQDHTANDIHPLWLQYIPLHESGRFRSQPSGTLEEIVDASDKKNEEDDEDANEEYLPMDESQILEAANLSEDEMISILKSRSIGSYLRPTIHTLFSRSNSLCNISPVPLLIQHLDSTASLFLNHYVYYLAGNTLNIGNDDFFVNYALRLAQQSQAVLYSLVAWGGMFLLGPDNLTARGYFYKGLSLAQERRATARNGKPLTSEEYLGLMSVYTLLMGAEISTGDVRYWFHLLLQSCDLLKEYGGIRKFVKDNRDVDGCGYIISNIFYHDVMGSRPLDFGTVFRMEDYTDIFRDGAWKEVGLDPFQGLSQGLYLLLGEIVNRRKQLKGMLFSLQVMYDSDTLGQGPGALQFAYRNAVNASFEEFDKRIDEAMPPRVLTASMEEEGMTDLLELHLTLFELLQYSLKIFIRINLKELPFTDTDIQSIKATADKLFEMLVGTRLQSLLCLPLLVIGLTCVLPEQRDWMREKCERYMDNYEVKNVRRCWEIVQEAWKKLDSRFSQGGEFYIDWSEIVTGLGWNCCFS